MSPSRTQVTRNPPADPPRLDCPKCSRRLTYVQSFLSGADPIEQWDQFACAGCTRVYDYRHRTGRLRPINAIETL
jgi:hypothetical protein